MGGGGSCSRLQQKGEGGRGEDELGAWGGGREYGEWAEGKGVVGGSGESEGGGGWGRQGGTRESGE